MNYDRPLTLDFKKTEIPATRFAIGFLKRELSIDLTPIQCEIFIMLNENGGGMTQRNLEECLDISKSTLSGVLNTMERNGFVRRSVSATDRRVMDVTLTDEGNGIFSKAMDRIDDLDRLIFDRLTDEERKALSSALEKIRRNVSTDDALSGSDA